MADPSRYPKPPPFTASGGDPAWWEERAREAIIDLLRTEHAVTVSEMEARLSDRTWNDSICSRKIQPHILSLARQQLLDEGVVEQQAATTSGSGKNTVTTWNRVVTRGRRAIDDASARKRKLSWRHTSWSQRGGNNLGLIGAAGERALNTALRANHRYSRVSGSTTNVLGVDLQQVGDVDNTAFLVDDSDIHEPVAITVMFEVKNTRQWYYETHTHHDGELYKFLHKAALVQQARPNVRILPVIVARRSHFTLWDHGAICGFLPTFVRNQLVIPDYDLDEKSFTPVRDELGYADLILGERPLKHHEGILETSIPKFARTYSTAWRSSHQLFLTPPPSRRATARVAKATQPQQGPPPKRQTTDPPGGTAVREGAALAALRILAKRREQISLDELTTAWQTTILNSLPPGQRALFRAGHFTDVLPGNVAVMMMPSSLHRDRCAARLANIEAELTVHFVRPVQVRLDIPE